MGIQRLGLYLRGLVRLAMDPRNVVGFHMMNDPDVLTSPVAGTVSTARPDLEDWPVDVQRTDASREVDLGQLEFNLSLTPLQRIEQNDAWVEFIQMARRAGQRLYGKQSPT
jgi:hypothetical protein